MVKPRLTNWLQELDSDAADEYNALRRSLRRNSGFGLFFVQCSPATGSNIIAEIREDITNKKIEVLHFDKSIDSLYSEIIAIPNLKEIDILFISGLEHSLVEYENYTFNPHQQNSQNNTEKRLTQDWQGVPRFLGYLNLQRDRFREEFDISFVFIVPLFGIDYFIKRAPDFFDWRSGLFRFIPQKDYITNVDRKNIFKKDLNQSRHELLDLETLIKELELDPTKEVEILDKKSLLFLQCHRYEEAVASYDKSLAINLDNDWAWFYRGYALGSLERYEEAVASCDKSLAINPDNDLAWSNRGYALDKLGRYEEAIASCDKSLAINPDNDWAWSNHGYALIKLERYEKAIASYDKSLAINPDNDWAWYYRGYALDKLGRYEEAIVSYDKSLAINPDNGLAWFGREFALERLERCEESL